jgi:hypothetical protein
MATSLGSIVFALRDARLLVAGWQEIRSTSGAY